MAQIQPQKSKGLAPHCRGRRRRRKITFRMEFGTFLLWCLKHRNKTNVRPADWEPPLVFYLSACLCALQPPVWVAALITARLRSLVAVRARGADWIRAPQHLWLRRRVGAAAAVLPPQLHLLLRWFNDVCLWYQCVQMLFQVGNKSPTPKASEASDVLSLLALLV